MEFGQTLCKGEAQTGSGFAAPLEAVDPEKGLEDVGQVALADPYTVVYDFAAEFGGVGVQLDCVTCPPSGVNLTALER